MAPGGHVDLGCSSQTELSIPDAAEKEQETIVVIGSGDLGRALTACLTRAGYRTVVASRNPEKNKCRIRKVGGEIETLPVAIAQGHIVLVAIPYEGFAGLSSELLRGKILIDPSNRSLHYHSKEQSLAARLQNFLPESRVVKAFNTLSAYTLQKGLSQGSREVPICSNDVAAKAEVSALVRNLGFHPVDFGALSNATEIEDIPLIFFPEWRFPFIFASVVLVFAFFFILFRSNLCPNFERMHEGLEWDWSSFVNIPFQNLHSTFGFASLTMLAACYLPGVLTAYIQLYKRTKYSVFPSWLDGWLKARKQLGILSLLFAIPHLILAIVTIINYGGLWGIWREPLYFACGVIAVVMMGILGVTSLPSVAANLTWKEFSFLQRYLGWFSLVFSTLHIVFIQWKGLVSNRFKCIFLPHTSQLFILLPLLTMLLKLPLLLPCVDSKIQKIRRGYEGSKSRP